MHGDAQLRKLTLQLLDGRIEALIGHFVAPVGAAGEQKAAEVLEHDEIAHLALQLRRAGRCDHWL
jgi:hypothetical protein